jgi:putative toxin-antitoxin system antitoxin component (TIGR02293 family)
MDPTLTENLQKVLGPAIGTQKALSATEIRTSVLKGFPYSTFERLQTELDLSQKELSTLLGIPQRTLVRRKEKKAFTSVESDRLYRLARVVAIAVDVLGDMTKARAWLKSPNRGLGGTVPLSLLDTEIGAQQAEDVLLRLKYGIYG